MGVGGGGELLGGRQAELCGAGEGGGGKSCWGSHSLS